MESFSVFSSVNHECGTGESHGIKFKNKLKFPFTFSEEYFDKAFRRFPEN